MLQDKKIYLLLPKNNTCIIDTYFIKYLHKTTLFYSLWMNWILNMMQGGTKENKSYDFDYAGNWISWKTVLLKSNLNKIKKYIMSSLVNE